MKLSATMAQALRLLVASPSTCTLVGAELTGRCSAYGPQTAAREGGRTLHALKRRGLVTVAFSEFDQKWLWSLTDEGRRQVALLPS